MSGLLFYSSEGGKVPVALGPSGVEDLGVPGFKVCVGFELWVWVCGFRV